MTTPEKQEGQKKMLSIVIGSICWLVFFCLIFFVLPGFLPIGVDWRYSIMFFLGIPAVLGCIYWLVYFRLAPNNLFWTLVEEGTSKAVMKGGQADKGLIQWKDHALDDDWNVVVGGGRHLFGGLRFYGIWPFKYIDTYGLRWTSVQENGEAVQHQELLDSVLLKEKIYAMRLAGAEDANRVPLNLDIFVTLKVINPYKARFIAEDYLELVLNRTGPLFREYVGGYTWEVLITLKQKAEGDIWNRLEEAGLITKFNAQGIVEQLGEFERDYGVQIKDGGIEIKNITPPPEYQKASTQAYLADKEAKRIAGEISGVVINMMAQNEGVTPEIMQGKINADTKLQTRYQNYCMKMYTNKLAAESGSWVKIDASGGSGMKRDLLELFASLIRMPQGKKQKEVNKEDEENKEEEELIKRGIERRKKEQEKS